MSTTSLKRRNSRWDDAAVLDKSGRAKAACITPRDIDGIFKPLTRYRYLPVDYIYALGGGSLDYLVNRLNLLCPPAQPLCRASPQQRANATANHRRLIYELAEKGWRVMQERGCLRERSRAPSIFRARADDLRADGLGRARRA